MFTVTYSVAPGTTPLFTLRTGSGSGILVQSVTATASSATDFFAFVTFPQSLAVYEWTFVASYTNGPVVDAGLCQAINTTAG